MADVWKISKENVEIYLNSVKEAFDKNYLYWLDNHLRILMAGLNPSTARNFKLGAVGSLGGGFAGYGMYQIGYLGDYLDCTNHRIISEKRFNKEYQVIEK